MKKRVLVLFFVLILISNLFFVLAEGNFSETKVNTWANNFDKFNSMGEDIKNKVWKDPSTTDQDRIDFLKKYIASKNPNLNVDLSGLEDKSLTWGEKGIFGTSEVYIDLEKLPNDLKKISFVKDGEKGKFIFEFDNGKIEVDKGFLNDKKEILLPDKDGKVVTYSWNGEGEFKFLNGEFTIKDSAKLVNNGHTFSVFTDSMKGSVKIKFDEKGNAEVTGFSRIDTETARLFRAVNSKEAFKVYFDAEDHGKTGTYAQINGNDLLKLNGDGLSVQVTSWFKNVNVQGDHMEIFNGNSIIKLENGKVTFPRNFYGVDHDIQDLRIGTLKESQNFQISNGRMYFYDEKGTRVLAGYTEVDVGRWGILDLAFIKSMVNQEDYNAIYSKVDSMIKRSDYNSDSDYNMAFQREMENLINLGQADWTLSVDPTSRKILGRAVSKYANNALSSSDLASLIARGYDRLDESTATATNNFVSGILENRPLVAGAVDQVVTNIPEVSKFLNNLGIADDLTVSPESSRAAREYITQNAEKIKSYIPDVIPIPEKMQPILEDKFGITANEIPKDVLMAVVTLSNNRETYVELGSFMENAITARGSGINVGVQGKQVGIVRDAAGRQYITSPEVVNAMRTVLTYVAPELLSGNQRFSIRGFNGYINTKKSQLGY